MALQFITTYIYISVYLPKKKKEKKEKKEKKQAPTIVMTFLSSRVDILNGPATAKNYAFLISPTYEKRLKNLRRKRGKTIVREKKKKNVKTL